MESIGSMSEKNIWYESEIKALKQQLHTDRENYQKEVALVREQCQIDLLEKDKRMIDLTNINKEHQKINGELQEKLSKYEDKVAHYRRKAVL